MGIGAAALRGRAEQNTRSEQIGAGWMRAPEDALQQRETVAALVRSGEWAGCSAPPLRPLRGGGLTHRLRRFHPHRGSRGSSRVAHSQACKYLRTLKATSARMDPDGHRRMSEGT